VLWPQLKFNIIWLVVRLFKGGPSRETAGGGVVSTVTKYLAVEVVVQGVIHGIYPPGVGRLVKR